MLSINHKLIQGCFLGLFLCLAACDPSIDEDIQIPSLPEAPNISVEVSPDNPNVVIIKDLSEGFFARVWELPGGTPEVSTLAIDTIVYRKAGTYNITLHAAKEGGGGTSIANQEMFFEEDAILACSEETIFLTGGCENLLGKCWTFSQVAGAVSVGPDPGSDEWFSSRESGLDPVQYDDSFCFTFEGSSFLYRNSGQTIDPFNGFVPVDFTPPTDLTYFIEEQGGPNGETRIILPEGAFIGVWDASPIYDIILLTEDELVLRTEFLNSGGWFDLYFVAR